MDDNAKSFRGKINVPSVNADINEKLTNRILIDIEHLPNQNLKIILEAIEKKLKNNQENKQAILKNIIELTNELETSDNLKEVKPVVNIEPVEKTQQTATAEPKENLKSKHSFLDLADSFLKGN